MIIAKANNTLLKVDKAFGIADLSFLTQYINATPLPYQYSLKMKEHKLYKHAF